MATMKITTERLNEIVEEEIRNFKRLNEQARNQLTPAQKLELVKRKVAKLTINDLNALDQILTVVGTGE